MSLHSPPLPRTPPQDARAVYLRLLERSPSALVYIQYMQFERRVSGVTAGRKVFRLARESRHCSPHVYIAAGTRNSANDLAHYAGGCSTGMGGVMRNSHYRRQRWSAYEHVCLYVCMYVFASQLTWSSMRMINCMSREMCLKWVDGGTARTRCMRCPTWTSSSIPRTQRVRTPLTLPAPATPPYATSSTSSSPQGLDGNRVLALAWASMAVESATCLSFPPSL